MSARKQHWEQVYASRSPLEVSWYQKEPTLSLRMIQDSIQIGAQPIIDVGGGASVLADRLLEMGYTNISVLDISARALQHLLERLGEQADRIKRYECDIIAFTPPHHFACWHDRAVFHFLTDADERKRYVQVLTEALPPGGHLVLAAFAIDGPTMCSGLDIVRYDAEKICTELGDEFKLLQQVNESHLTPTHQEQLFTYYSFVRT